MCGHGMSEGVADGSNVEYFLLNGLYYATSSALRFFSKE